MVAAARRVGAAHAHAYAPSRSARPPGRRGDHARILEAYIETLKAENEFLKRRLAEAEGRVAARVSANGSMGSRTWASSALSKSLRRCFTHPQRKNLVQSLELDCSVCGPGWEA
jgi:hypothetical protein